MTTGATTAADLSLGSCETPPTPDCQLMVDVVTAAEALLGQMFQDGVEDVVWFFYPDPTDATLLAKFEVLRPLLQGVCESSTVPCHWLDLRPIFADHYSEYMLPENLLPTAEGAQATAAAIWSTMQRDCIAQ